MTFIARSRGLAHPEKFLARLIPAYVELLSLLANAGVVEVQIHEPELVTAHAATLKSQYESAYAILAKEKVAINLVTYFGDLGETYPFVMSLPVSIISLDFVRGNNLSLIEAHGFPSSKKLGAGVIDGRNVWKATERPLAIISTLKALVGPSVDIRVQPSSSLQHVPMDVLAEKSLPTSLLERLAFARQKLVEVVTLSQSKIPEGIKVASSEGSTNNEDKKVPKIWFDRSETFAQRRSKQVVTPLIPTTSIGSFPQTNQVHSLIFSNIQLVLTLHKQVRKLRLQYKKGEISEAAYEQQIACQIAYCIGAQEALGLDILVHGEPERSDMVEYFGLQLDGFAFTENGWVQSYGSRYVRPPIIHSDVSRHGPMTVKEYVVAANFASKPVKGMLTGPVTILNWSFPRTDISRKDQAYQIALALRDEVADLQDAGCRIIQVNV